MDNEKPLILIVDDNYQNVQVLASLIAIKNYNITVANSGEEALAVLRKCKPNLILLDVLMPEMDGFETCRRIKRNVASKDIPIIFISAKNDEDFIVKGFEAGAVDYVSKPFRSLELIARISTHLELTLVKENLFRLSMLDELTQLYNRRYFVDKLENSIEMLSVHGEPCAIILLDVDNFKRINDTFGHDVGDLSLQRIGELGNSIISGKSLFCRFGGDEFAFFLPNFGKKDAMDLADNFRVLVDEQSKDDITNIPHFTVSIGVTIIRNSTSNHIDVLKLADKALYASKNSGRNSISFE